MVGFGITYPKPNHDPNVPMLIWNMVRFRTPSVPNPTCSKFDLGYPKLDSEHNHVSDMDIPNRKVRFGKSEIEMSIWECPKSNSEQKWIWATTCPFQYFILNTILSILERDSRDTEHDT